MKRMLYLSVLVCSLNAMDESFVIMKDGDEEFSQSYNAPEDNQIIVIQTDGSNLDPNCEHAYLSGMCDVLRDLGYGMVDLRRIEENIARVRGGSATSKFKHEWDPSHSEQKVRNTVPVSLVFESSKTSIKSPHMVPVLPKDHTLELKSNLKNRAVALSFVTSVLNPVVKDGKRYVFLHVLEKAVLAELQEKSGK